MVESNGLLNRRRCHSLPGVRIPLSPPAGEVKSKTICPPYPMAPELPKSGDEFRAQRATSDTLRGVKPLALLVDDERSEKGRSSAAGAQHLANRPTNPPPPKAHIRPNSEKLSSKPNLRHRTPSECQATRAVRRQRANLRQGHISCHAPEF